MKKILILFAVMVVLATSVSTSAQTKKDIRQQKRHERALHQKGLAAEFIKSLVDQHIFTVSITSVDNYIFFGPKANGLTSGSFYNCYGDNGEFTRMSKNICWTNNYEFSDFVSKEGKLIFAINMKINAMWLPGMTDMNCRFTIIESTGFVTMEMMNNGRKIVDIRGRLISNK